MLRNVFLGSNLIYFSTAHTLEIIDRYARVSEEILNAITIHGDEIVDYINGPICHSGFSRLT